jgi:TIR domain
MDTFEAFISYCHAREDRKWAVWLQNKLERYKTPKPLTAAGTRARLNRVFRDDDELAASGDLNEAIRAALTKSRYLIVVCTERTPSSLWVNAEIEYFAGLGRLGKILVLLVDGEPATAFPAALKVLGREPLAADVRPGRGLFDKRRRIALLKIVAALLECGYDDLFQREQQRILRARRTMIVTMGVLLVLGALAAQNAILSRVQELATYSDQNLSTDPTLSVLLSRAAFEKGRFWLHIGQQSARPALERALMASPLRDGFYGHDSLIRGLAWSTNGIVAAG